MIKATARNLSQLVTLAKRSTSDFVKVVEVGPRDGLQNIKQIVPTGIKIQLIDRLSECGFRSVESTSFVSPKWIPQLADCREVLAGIKQSDTTDYPVLVPNMKGLDAALACHVKEIGIFTAASESFCKKNTNCSIAESLQRFLPVIHKALEKDLRVRAYVSCVVGCPYEGQIAPRVVAELTARLLELGCYEVSLGDTIGVGTPGQVKTLLQHVLATAPPGKLALHYHDTYGQALANVLVGLEHGIRVFDSSVAGLGGCPYAAGASGNVATEDLLYLLHGSGLDTGVSLDRVIDTGHFISQYLQRDNLSKVSVAVRSKT